MTKEEAIKVLKTMSYADGGCVVCVEGQFGGFLSDFPEFKEEAKRIWIKKRLGSEKDFEERMEDYE